MGDCALGIGSRPPLKPAQVSLLQLQNAHHPLMKQLGQVPAANCSEEGFPHDAEHFVSIPQGGNNLPMPTQLEETWEGSTTDETSARE